MGTTTTTTTATDGGCAGPGFEELLLEAWSLCTDDDTVRASSEYKCARKWLNKVTKKGHRDAADMKELRELVCTLRTAANGCGGRAAVATCPVDACARDGGTEVAVRARPPVNDKLKAALAAAQDECLDMRRFMREVAAFTCDGGALLMRVTRDVLSEFRAFVDTVFGNRVSQIGAVLAGEQMALRDRYAELECRTMNRAQLALTHVRDVMPSFDWHRYASEPGYIRSVIVSRCMRSAADDDADIENGRAKELLYQLNWLRSEIDRVDCENHGLHAQLTALIAELASVNGKILADQCRADADRKRLTCELDGLRSKSSDQACTVDKLMETIQISIQNSKADAPASGGASAANPS